jgi:DNA-binding MarR family transcriptional regulator
MGRKGKHKGRKKDRREAALAETADAVRDRGARGRLAPELWLDPMAAPDDAAVGPDAVDEPAASARSASRIPAGTSDPAELAARLAGLGTVLQRLLGRLDSAGSEGLTRARLSALALLVLGGPRRLGELASAERVRPPTMSRLVDAMEADGWVMRVPDPADGRSVIVRATAAGEAHLELARARQLAPLAESIADLKAPDRRTLEAGADVLERLLRTVGRPDDPPVA